MSSRLAINIYQRFSKFIMKTRRKATKASRGRRSSVICVKKSPINRKNTGRTLRSQTKNSRAFHYESPLKSVRHNGQGSSLLRPTHDSSTSIVIGDIDEDVEVEDKNVKIEEKEIDISNLNIKGETVDRKDTNQVDIVDSESPNTSTESSTNSKRKAKVDMLTALQNRKKRKTLKKSPLSRFNESDEKSSESIIILDDSESAPDTKPVLTESKNNVPEVVNTSFQEIDQSIVKTEPLPNPSSSDEVVVIDCDSSYMEMEAYHDAFNQDGNWSPISLNQNWSPVNANENCPPENSNENLLHTIENDPIIVIPDDDSPIQTRSTSPQPVQKYISPIQARPTTPKTNDDCFVVWSSIPTPSTSNAEPQNTRIPNYDPNLLKCDKIFLDTTPDVGNLNVLSNENNIPKTSVKLTKDTAKTKKSLLKSPKATKTASKTAKAGVKTTKTAKTATATAATRTATATTKTATATARTAAATKIAAATSRTATAASKTATTTSKAATSTSKTAVKKKTKNKGELIFLSESQEEDGLTKKTKAKKGKLREIVIDGSNVAMAYTHSKMFSEKGIKMLIDYFTKRGHSVKVFVPQHRRSRNCPLLEKWYTDGIVVFTPSRKLGNKTFTPYDDRYILEYATARNGIVVSQDQFRDLYAEKPEYRDTIENRILVPTFVGDYVMFPEDPLGRDGPSLSDFLRH